MSSILEKDIELLSKEYKKFTFLNNSSIFITGGTGLLGSILVRSLVKYNINYNKGLSLYILVRDINKAKNIFTSYIDNLTFIEGDVESIINIDDKIDYVLHFACTTSSKEFVERPVDTINSVVNGTQNILEFSKRKDVKSVLFLSSLEVYGVPNSEQIIVKESDSGYLDQTSIRSSYSEGKRLAECLCVAYSKQYGVPVRIARLCQTFGAGVSWNDNRVFADFAKKIIKQEDIILKTSGKTLRNYCYTTDAILAILTILDKGIESEAYNVANKDFALSIRDMANYFVERFATHSNVIIDTSISAEKLGYNPEVKILLDTEKLENLGWKAHISQENAFEKLITHLTETQP